MIQGNFNLQEDSEFSINVQSPDQQAPSRDTMVGISVEARAGLEKVISERDIPLARPLPPRKTPVKKTDIKDLPMAKISETPQSKSDSEFDKIISDFLSNTPTTVIDLDSISLGSSEDESDV